MMNYRRVSTLHLDSSLTDPYPASSRRSTAADPKARLEENTISYVNMQPYGSVLQPHGWHAFLGLAKSAGSISNLCAGFRRAPVSY
jgi:hypothetical protein